MAHVALILVLLTLCYGVSSRPISVIECPDQYAENIWFNRAVKVCPEDRQTYHCLMVTSITSTARYGEFCQKPERIRKGEYVVYDVTTKTIVHKACPHGRFQPVERTSNSSMAYQCEKVMTPCNLQGQKPCDDGRPDEDRTCGCEFEKGYSLEALADISNNDVSCVHPLSVDLTCTQLDMCTEEQELNKYYQCVNKCPVGYYRRNGGGCFQLPINMSSTPSPTITTKTNLVTTTVKDDSVDNVMIPNKENDKGAIAIAMGIVSIVLLMTAISAGIFCYCFKQNCSGISAVCGLCNQSTDDTNGANGFPACIVCCHVTHLNQKINVKKADTVAMGNKSKITSLDTKKKKEKKKKSESVESLPLLSQEKQDITDDGGKEDSDDLTVPKTIPGSKGSDSDDCVNEDALDPEATTPKEIASDKDQDPDDSVVENTADANSTVPKEVESTKEIESVEKEDCNEYMKDMKLAAKKKGWEVEDVPKDGSCFYHCVLKLYVSKNGWDVSTLRKKLRKYLESNAKQYKDFVPESWENLLRGTENNKWADHVEIKAMAEMLKVPIIIHKLNSTGDQLEVKEEITPKNCHVEPLNIGHILVNKEGFHFVALVPMRLTES